MKKLKIGIIGIGKMGSLHAKTIQNNPNCELIGFFDIDKDALNKAVNTFPNTIILESIDKVQLYCDAVYICVPASKHFDYLSIFINKNLHIFCEKPSVVGFINYKFIKSLIEFNNFKEVIHIGQVEKFNPLIAYTKKYLNFKNDEFIRASFFRLSNTSRNEDVSCIYDTMVHDIDLAYHLFPNLDLLLKVEIKDVVADGDYIYSAKVYCTFKNWVIKFIADKRNDNNERAIFINEDTLWFVDLKEKKIFKNNLLMPESEYANSSKDQLTQQLDCFVAACSNKLYWNGTTFNENSKVIELADLIEKEAKIYLKNKESKSLI
jgi:predicted dehydrogenase